MVTVTSTSTSTGHLHADCSDCGWQCVGAPSDAFTHAVNVHVGQHRSPWGPVLAGLVQPRPQSPRASASCRYADGEHGPCGGPSNGRECWQHATVATR